MQELYKKHREEICKYCQNKDCENSSGIRIFSYNGIREARCIDYKTDIVIPKNNLFLLSEKERKNGDYNKKDRRTKTIQK